MTRQVGEHRHDVRVVVNGTALVHAEHVTRGRIVDLSIGGVRVNLDGAIRRGAWVRVDLHLDGGAARWLRCHGQVTRSDHDGSVAVHLDQVPVDFEDIVHDEVLAAMECELVPQVLLVDRVEGRRQAWASDLRAAGCRVVEAATPLEAIAHLGESQTHAWLVAIAATVPARDAVDLRDFLDAVGGASRATLRVDLDLAGLRAEVARLSRRARS